MAQRRAAPTEGWCGSCQCAHTLPWAPAREAGLHLAQQLAETQALPVDVGVGPSTEGLFGPSRGKMFGVLEAHDPRTGEAVTLRAFSGQYEGRWTVPGWVAPLFDVAQWHATSEATEPGIKALTREIDSLPSGDARRKLVAHRKAVSAQLMVDFHALYQLHNFSGRTLGLLAASLGDTLATGTGDCCAPKLLNAAARRGLVPLGLAEFYWGATNLSQTRQHQVFYSACDLKCGPILGHLLCGSGQPTSER